MVCMVHNSQALKTVIKSGSHFHYVQVCAYMQSTFASQGAVNGRPVITSGEDIDIPLCSKNQLWLLNEKADM